MTRASKRVQDWRVASGLLCCALSGCCNSRSESAVDGGMMVDEALPEGTLEVELSSGIEGVIIEQPAVILERSSKTKARWMSHFPARLEHLPVGIPLSIAVDGPYFGQPMPTLTLPKKKGAKVTLEVISKGLPPTLTPGSNTEDVPKPILHIDMTDPNQFLLVWKHQRTVLSRSAVARKGSDPSYSELLQAVQGPWWKEKGAHTEPNETRRDQVVLWVLPETPISVLKSVLQPIARMTTPGQPTLAFKVFAQVAIPEEKVDVEAEVAALELRAAASSDASAVAELLHALRKCGIFVAPTIEWASSEAAAPASSCATTTLSRLWLHLGESLAKDGQPQAATRALYVARAVDPKLRVDTSIPGAKLALEGSRRLPVLKVRAGATTINGRLPPAQITQAIASHEGAFRMCYALGLIRTPALTGRVATRFVIGNDGQVSNLGNGGSDLPDANLVRCVFNVQAGMTFPEPESGIVTVVSPWQFGS